METYELISAIVDNSFKFDPFAEAATMNLTGDELSILLNGAHVSGKILIVNL